VGEVTIHTIQVEWRPPTLHREHHAAIQDYAVALCPEQAVFEDFANARMYYTADLTMIIDNLLPSEKYKLRVRCRSASGWSDWSTWVFAQTLCAVPEAPLPVEIVKVSINGLLLRWEAPARDNGHVIDHYELEIMDEQMQKAQDRSLRGAVHLTQHIGVLGKEDGTVLHRRGIFKKAPTIGEEVKPSGSHSVAGQGGVSKLHRVVKHRDVHNLYKSLTGLEPGRKYVIRCRAHNLVSILLYSNI
jgi:hypothetical protein